jgi:hypothetical protein
MAISVCPGDEVNASVDAVWALLDDPARFDVWWDARMLEATPPGLLTPGQHIVARAKGAFPARVLCDVVAVDPAKHRIQMTVRLPFGIVDHFTVIMAATDPARCFVRFGCDFEFPPGWRGRWLERMLSGSVARGVEDSLRRLKAAAEREATAARRGVPEHRAR